MHRAFRSRLIAIASGLVVLLALVGRLAHDARRHSEELRQHFERVQHENARIAARLRLSIQSLDASLLRFKLRGDPATWAVFNEQAAAMRAWLKGERAELEEPTESRILEAIDAQLTEYLREATEFARPGEPAAFGADSEARLETITQRSDNILALGFDLAEAHTRTLEADFAGAARAITQLEWLTLAALGLTVVSGSGAAWIVYRDYIAPLRSELHENRRRLERQEKLASLGVLSAGIAHEIRNPLTAVKARLFTLGRAVPPGSEAAEDVRVIDGEMDRLSHIVGDFLKFARPPEPDMHACEASEVLARVAALLRPQYPAHQITVEASAVPPMWADPDQIAQVVINLVRNAAEAMPAGGPIELRATAGGEAGTVRIDVCDHGPGIAPEAQARLFDPFFTTKSSGTGLGLALSARILEKHGGTIRFATTPGAGTTFTLILPVHQP